MPELKVIELRAENFARLKCVELELRGDSLVVSGRNAQGKSSVLRAVEAALCGRGAAPALPVHEGEEAATVRVTLGESPDLVHLIVEKTWKDGKERLVVTNAEGVRQGSARTVLDAIRGALGFDVMAFATPAGMKTEAAADKARVEMLAEIAPLPIDLAEHAAERKAIFDDRTTVNRTLREAEAGMAGRRTQDVPPRVEMRELMAKMDAAEAAIASGRDRAGALARCRDGYAGATALLADIDDKIEALAQDRVESIATWKADGEEARRQAAEAGDPPDVTAIRDSIATVSETNEESSRIEAANDALAKDGARRIHLAETAQALTDRLDGMDAAKRDALASVALPAGLSLTEDGAGVLLGGRPFSAASTSERIRASVRVMAARHPKLRTCLVRDGNDLDADAMSEVLGFAREEGLQLIVERISADVPGSVVIEDGQVEG